MNGSFGFSGDVFSELEWLQHHLEQAFRPNGMPANIRSPARGTFPAFNVGSTPDSVEVLAFAPGIDLVADLPDVSKEQLGVRADGENLLIEGTASVPVAEGFELVHQEVRHPAYRRSFTLSRELDASRIEAALKDGVLTLHIPKAEEARPRRIEVKVG